MTELSQHIADVLHMVNTLIPNPETAFIFCYAFPMALAMLFYVVKLLYKAMKYGDASPTQPIEIDTRPFWDALNNGLAGDFRLSDEKRKNDDDEVFDEKRKRIEDEEVDESYWTVGDDGELVEEKRKR